MTEATQRPWDLGVAEASDGIGMTNATPHWFDDANPDTWCRCHNLNRTEIRTEIIVNSHDALVAALEQAIPMLTFATQTRRGMKRARLAAIAALEAAK